MSISKTFSLYNNGTVKKELIEVGKSRRCEHSLYRIYLLLHGRIVKNGEIAKHPLGFVTHSLWHSLRSSISMPFIILRKAIEFHINKGDFIELKG